MKPVFVLNGPNLNLLGTREPDIYGSESLADVAERCRKRAAQNSLSVEFRQSNIEGELVSWVQESRHAACGIVINAAAYTHTSVALQDALKSCGLPAVEVHLSNIYKRELFRHKSYISPVAAGVICGIGGFGYELAIEALVNIMKSAKGG